MEMGQKVKGAGVSLAAQTRSLSCYAQHADRPRRNVSARLMANGACGCASQRPRLSVTSDVGYTREEPTAFLTLDELKALPVGSALAGLPLRIICVSHCWHGQPHPDPLGEQLIRLADLIEREQNDATCSGSVPFPTGEFAVFFDFLLAYAKG